MPSFFLCEFQKTALHNSSTSVNRREKKKKKKKSTNAPPLLTSESVNMKIGNVITFFSFLFLKKKQQTCFDQIARTRMNYYDLVVKKKKKKVLKMLVGKQEYIYVLKTVYFY